MAYDPNCPDTQAAIAAAVAEATEATEAKAAQASSALAANNKKLLAQLTEARKGAQIDPIKQAELEDQIADLKGQIETANKGLTRAQKDAQTKLEALQKQYDAEAGFTSALLVDNGLGDALVKAGVEPHFLPAVKAMLKPNVAVVAEGDKRVAKVGDKALAEFVTGWAASDEGKFYVKAPVNGGGGAAGGGAGGAGKVVIQATDKAAFGNHLAEIAKGAGGNVQFV